PHTLIFLLPLFLILGKDKTKLADIYNSFLGSAEGIRSEAVEAIKKYAETLACCSQEFSIIV
ncbi:MAG: hypothetical protein R3182_00715, partial [Draconibacterium sp.]|nr:hypothetical protein [Draconibacterium sp.]